MKKGNRVRLREDSKRGYFRDWREWAEGGALVLALDPDPDSSSIIVEREDGTPSPDGVRAPRVTRYFYELAERPPTREESLELENLQLKEQIVREQAAKAGIDAPSCIEHERRLITACEKEIEKARAAIEHFEKDPWCQAKKAVADFVEKLRAAGVEVPQ